MKLFTLYLQSIIQLCIEYCCHVWAGAPSCYLELLERLRKRICGTVGPSLTVSFAPLTHCQMKQAKASFIGITLVDPHPNWLSLFHFFILMVGLYVILMDCIIFLSPLPDVTRMVMSTVSFLA